MLDCVTCDPKCKLPSSSIFYNGSALENLGINHLDNLTTILHKINNNINGSLGGVTSVNEKSGVVVLDSGDIAEGGSNKYYTEARVSANVYVAANTAARHTHANMSVLDATEVAYTIADKAKVDGFTPGGATVAGTDTQVQFNDGGVLGASSGLTFDKADSYLSVGINTYTNSEVRVGSESGTGFSTLNSDALFFNGSGGAFGNLTGTGSCWTGDGFVNNHPLIAGGPMVIHTDVSQFQVPDPSAALHLAGTQKGFLPNRMTGAQVETIATPAEGLLVYATDGSGTTVTTKGLWEYDGVAWAKIQPIDTPITTGTAVIYTMDRIYGSYASPESGNITESLTDAKNGVSILIFHQSGTEPTYPATWIREQGVYKPSELNIIRATHIAGFVYYSINQLPTSVVAGYGKVIVVDSTHPNATDTRAGISNYAIDAPFLTYSSGLFATGALQTDVLLVRNMTISTLITSHSGPRTVIFENCTITTDLREFHTLIFRNSTWTGRARNNTNFGTEILIQGDRRSTWICNYPCQFANNVQIRGFHTLTINNLSTNGYLCVGGISNPATPEGHFKVPYIVIVDDILYVNSNNRFCFGDGYLFRNILKITHTGEYFAYEWTANGSCGATFENCNIETSGTFSPNVNWASWRFINCNIKMNSTIHPLAHINNGCFFYLKNTNIERVAGAVSVFITGIVGNSYIHLDSSHFYSPSAPIIDLSGLSLTTLFAVNTVGNNTLYVNGTVTEETNLYMNSSFLKPLSR